MSSLNDEENIEETTIMENTTKSFMANHIQSQMEQERNEAREIPPESLWTKYKKKTIEILHTTSFHLRHWTKYHFFVLIFLIAIIVPTLIFAFVYTDYKYDSSHSCDAINAYRVPCGQKDINETDCFAIKCCYNHNLTKCYHKVPSLYQYVSTDTDWNDGFKPSVENSPFGTKTIEKLYFTYTLEEQKVTITLSKNPIVKSRIVEDENENFKVNVFSTEMGIEIIRKSNDQMLLTTNHGPAIASDGYWEWTLDLNTTHLYGLNEFRFPDDVTTTRVVYPNWKEHGVVPKFMAVKNTLFHGVAVRHSGPLEISVLPSKMIILRMLSGEDVHVDLVIGPRPVDVLRQQRVEPVVPPYWALGVHICRDGNISSIQSVIEEFQKGIKYNSFIYESDCIHENLFSIDVKSNEIQKIKDALTELGSYRKKFVMSLSPQIFTSQNSFNNAQKMGILYQWPNDTVVYGTYLNKSVAYPDFNKPNTKDWLEETMETIIKTYDINNIQGFVLRNNWPSNENNNSKVTSEDGSFAYLSQDLETSMSNTIPWNAESNNQKHISLHNNYGHRYTEAVINSQGNAENLLVLSASYTEYDSHGSHTQNVDSTWMDLKNVLTSTLSQSLFGSLTSSIPVCGTTKIFNEKNTQLNMRWYLTAITLPIFRISSDFPRRDPLSFQSKQLQEVAKNAINMRYSLLPFYYTVLSGKLPMVQPMFFNYGKDEETYNLDEQYMIGESLLVAQPMVRALSSWMSIYLPGNPNGWFDFSSGKHYISGFFNITVVQTDTFMYIPAGHIIPYTEVSNTVFQNADNLRNLPLSLLSAVDCEEQSCKSSGNWCVMENNCLKFDISGKELRISNVQQMRQLLCSNYKIATAKIDCVKIYSTEIVMHRPFCNNINIDLCDSTIGNEDVIFKQLFA